MSVDAATVRRIAHLARIAVADDEVEHLRGEINAILAFVEQLSEVNVEGVEPMTSVTPMAMKKREDKVTDGEIADVILRNAPASEGHVFPRAQGCRVKASRMCLACEEAGHVSTAGSCSSRSPRARCRRAYSEDELRAMGLPLPDEVELVDEPDGTKILRQKAPQEGIQPKALVCDSPDE